jgi:hypothetical protein
MRHGVAKDAAWCCGSCHWRLSYGCQSVEQMANLFFIFILFDYNTHPLSSFFASAF